MVTGWLDVDFAGFVPAISFGGGAAAKTPAPRQSSYPLFVIGKKIKD
jgi:hypothetical protein